MTKPVDHHQPLPPPPPQSFLHRITAVDKTLSYTIHTAAAPIIQTPILKLLEISGDGRLWFPLTLSLLLSPLSLRSPPLHSLSISLLLGLITDIIIIGILKHRVRRPRPAHNSHPMGATLPVDRWSFPSGHASRTWFVAAFFCLSATAVRRGFEQLAAGDPEILSSWIGDRDIEAVVQYLVGGVLVWAVVTSASRVFLGRHYVADVVVGSVVGVLNAFFVHRYLRF